jgi:hypothetical protein
MGQRGDSSGASPEPAASERIVRTGAEELCLAKLRELVGEADGPIERHSARVALIAQELAPLGSHTIDREVVVCASWLHDAGLYPGAATRQAYVSDGRVLTIKLLAQQGWTDERLRLCGDAVERHHELSSQWRRGVEVELIRRADLVDLSQGFVRFGLSRSWLHDLRSSIPVDGFIPEVLRQLAVAARRRPASLPRIFFPGGGS